MIACGGEQEHFGDQEMDEWALYTNMFYIIFFREYCSPNIVYALKEHLETLASKEGKVKKL